GGGRGPMFCWRCGYELAEGAASCQTCGADAEPSSKSDTQAMPAPDPGVRTPAPPPEFAPASVPPKSPAFAAPKAPAPRRRGWRILSPLLMLFAAGIIMAVGSLGVWQVVRQQGGAAPQAAEASPAPAATPASLPDGRPSVALSPADPAAAPASGT